LNRRATGHEFPVCRVACRCTGVRTMSRTCGRLRKSVGAESVRFGLRIESDEQDSTKTAKFSWTSQTEPMEWVESTMNREGDVDQSS
jgi:hypothetical protein